MVLVLRRARPRVVHVITIHCHLRWKNEGG